MHAVIKQKVQSKLSNDDAFDLADKAMYENKRVKYDNVTGELYTTDEPA